MSVVIKIIPVLLFFAGLAYVKWRLTPPRDVVGSYLEDTDARARQLQRAAQHQHYKESWHRSDPS